MTEYKNNAVISFSEDLNAELKIFRVTPDEGQVPEFQAGQYAELALPELDERSIEERRKLLRRAYSIASPPSQRNYLEFFVVRVEGGAITTKLWDLKVGDRLWLGPKVKGKFVIDELPEGKDIVLVSTGTGLSPFVSMVKEHLNSEKFNSFTIVHGTRVQSDLGYREELEQMARENSKLSYISALTREPEISSWKGHIGRVPMLLEPKKFQELTGRALDPEKVQIFLCGNPAMIEDLIVQLHRSGFKEHTRKDPGNIHVERFW
jgi:ferredoxin--NADP+ reductase